MKVPNYEAMVPKYELLLMFEWRGGCLWCLNDAAREAFDVGPVEDRIGLTEEILTKMDKLTEWHDTALNWDYPPDPGPWQKAEYEAFDIAALEIMYEVKKCLGPKFRVFYDKLGYFEES